MMHTPCAVAIAITTMPPGAAACKLVGRDHLGRDSLMIGIFLLRRVPGVCLLPHTTSKLLRPRFDADFAENGDATCDAHGKGTCSDATEASVIWANP